MKTSEIVVRIEKWRVKCGRTTTYFGYSETATHKFDTGMRSDGCAGQLHIGRQRNALLPANCIISCKLKKWRDES